EKSFRVGVGERDGRNSVFLELKKDGMLAQNIEQGAIWKSLFVTADSRSRVDPRQNRCLARGALRPSRHPQTRIRWNGLSIEWYVRRLAVKNCQRLTVVQAIEG